MPYIEEARRGELDRDEDNIRTAGELNYAITRLCLHYMGFWGDSYQRMNDVVGALEGAKLEFYRRKVAPYEDVKLYQNGDVY